MAVQWQLCFGDRSLRAKCFIIGYLNLLSCAVDLGCHIVILSIVTNFYSCDVDLTAFQGIDWTWLETFLVVINIGTHGFYPFPLVPYHDTLGVLTAPQCFPGMLHINLIDLIDIAIHLIWLRLVVSYIAALHKKDPEPMRMFFSLSILKIFLQLLYFAYKPYFYSEMLFETHCSIKIIDIAMAVIFLYVIYNYIRVVREEKSANAQAPAPVAAESDLPPSYNECLTHQPTKSNDNLPQIIVNTEQKTEA